MRAPPPIRSDLAFKKTERRARRRAVAIVAAAGSTLTLGLVDLFMWRLVFVDLPRVPATDALWSLNRPPGMTFLDAAGRTIAVRGVRHGAPVRLTSLPAYVPRAFLAAEDRRFYAHAGVDLVGALRALGVDARERRIAQGGSTLTQQLARTLFLGSEQTFKRKAQEAVLALELEHRLTKRAILELYLDRVYLGAGAYGLDAAAHAYFGKTPERLDLAEAALLAALPKAPSRLDPNTDLAAAQARARIVLRAMQNQGWIDADQASDATRHPASLASESQVEGDFGYALDAAQAQAREHVGTSTPDLVVTLTLDPALQHAAAATVRWAVAQSTPRGATQGALVALGLDGGVLALVGGLDHRTSPFDRATQALRQPGSAFKPFVYASALAEGDGPDDVRVDAPVRYGSYAPKNFGGGYAGSVTLADAFARSINTVAVQLAQEVGPAHVAQLARRFGLSTIPSDPSLPLALGAYEVRLIDLVGAYQVFQAQGLRREPHLVTRIANAHGDALWRWKGADGERVYDAGHAAQMTALMQDVIEHGTGRRAAIGRPAAGKTGTTQASRDAWFVGFTPDLVAGVWLGDDRDRPMAGLEGGQTPAQAWARFMRIAEADRPVRDFAPDPQTLDARAAFYASLADQFAGVLTED